MEIKTILAVFSLAAPRHAARAAVPRLLCVRLRHGRSTPMREAGREPRKETRSQTDQTWFKYNPEADWNMVNCR